jgi:hypothetical protein
MFGAGGLDAGFQVAQRGRLGLQLDRRLLDVARQPLALLAGLIALVEPEQVLPPRQLGDVVDLRTRFSRVSARRFSVSRRRSLYLVMPAASSRKARSSSGRASMMREIMPCSMMA